MCSYNNNEPLPCTHMMLKAYVDSKITTFLFVNIYVYLKHRLLYPTTTTPMLIHRLKIYMIMLPPSKMYSNHTSTTMCMNPKLTLPLIFYFFTYRLLCIYLFTVENIPSIRFHKLHVYKQLYTCIFACLDKYTICFIVSPVCINHLSLIMYLFYC